MCLQFDSLSHFGNVPEKSGSMQEAPRAKKEVNGSLSPHERGINKTNGCI